MSILDQFYILFKADTSDLEKGQKTALKSTSELQDKIKSTNADTLDLGASFIDLAQKAASAIGVVIGLGAAVKSIYSAEQNAQTIGLFSQTTGEAVGHVDALAQANMRFGGTLETTLGTLKRLKEGLTFLTPYGGVGDATPLPTQLALTARQYGIRVAPGTTIQNFLDEVHNKFKGQDPARNLKIGEALGFDEAFIRTLQQSDEEYNKLRESIAKIGTETANDAESVFKWNQQWAEFSQQIGVIERSVGGPILDGLTELIKGFKELGEAILIVATGVYAVGAAFEAAGIITWAAPTAGLLAPLAALAVAYWPLLLIIAAIGAIWALLRYGPEIASMLGAAFGAFFTKMKEWGSDVVQVFKDLFGWAGKIIQSIQNFSLWKKSSDGPTPEGQGQIDEYKKQEMILRAHRAITGASSSPFSSQGGSVINGQRSSSVHIEKLEVHTQATDAEGVASAIGSSLQKHINFAINNYNSSVLA